MAQVYKSFFLKSRLAFRPYGVKEPRLSETKKRKRATSIVERVFSVWVEDRFVGIDRVGVVAGEDTRFVFLRGQHFDNLQRCTTGRQTKISVEE